MPRKIEAHLVESDDFLGVYALRHYWTPFEAACLIAGHQPGPDVSDDASIGVVETGLLTNELITEFNVDKARQKEVIDRVCQIGEALLERWPSEKIVASEAIEWALGKGFQCDSSFVQMVLGRATNSEHEREIERLKDEIAALKRTLSKQSDGRGKHFEDSRLAILGVAIRELALNLGNNPDKIESLLHGESVNASGLAKHLDENREGVGLPDTGETKFGCRQIQTVLQSALRSAKNLSGRSATGRFPQTRSK